MVRDYVLLNKNFDNMEMLIFIGVLSKDDEKRNKMGCTSDLRKCERYTKDEVLNMSNIHVVSDDEKIMDIYKKNMENFTIAITIDNIKRLGYHTKLICVF